MSLTKKEVIRYHGADKVKAGLPETLKEEIGSKVILNHLKIEELLECCVPSKQGAVKKHLN